MGLERVDPGTVAPEQQIEASTSPTSREPSVRSKSSPLSSESVNPSEMDFKETMDALTKALMEFEETGRERLTIQCDSTWRASLSWRTSSLTWVLVCGYAGQPWPSRSAWSPWRRGSQ